MDDFLKTLQHGRKIIWKACEKIMFGAVQCNHYKKWRLQWASWEYSIYLLFIYSYLAETEISENSGTSFKSGNPKTNKILQYFKGVITNLEKVSRNCEFLLIFQSPLTNKMTLWQPLVRRRTQSLNPYNPVGIRLYGNAPMVVTHGATHGHPGSIPSSFHHRRLTSGNAGYPFAHPRGGTAYNSQGYNSARGYGSCGYGGIQGMGENYMMISDFMSPRRGFTG